MKRQSPLCFLESGMVLCYTVHKSSAVKVSVRADFPDWQRRGRSGETAPGMPQGISRQAVLITGEYSYE